MSKKVSLEAIDNILGGAEEPQEREKRKQRCQTSSQEEGSDLSEQIAHLVNAGGNISCVIFHKKSRRRKFDTPGHSKAFNPKKYVCL